MPNAGANLQRTANRPKARNVPGGKASVTRRLDADRPAVTTGKFQQLQQFQQPVRVARGRHDYQGRFRETQEP